MQNILFLMPHTNKLCILDNLACLKNEQELYSPFRCARMDFWWQFEAILGFETPWTPEQRLLYSSIYWSHPPTLALPERAASLHCPICGDGCSCIDHDLYFFDGRLLV